MDGTKISGRNSTILLGGSSTALYAICDIASKFEIDRKIGTEEIITYCEVEPVAGAQTGSIKGTLYAKKGSPGVVVSIAVTNGGSNFTSAPTVVFAGGAGTGAAAKAVIDAVTKTVTAVLVTSNGSGYTSAPTISFTGGGGTGAAATAKITGYNSDWLEPLFSGNLTTGGRIYYEIHPDGDATGKPSYTGYFVPTGWKMNFPEDKGSWSFDFDGITNGWPTIAAQS